MRHSQFLEFVDEGNSVDVALLKDYCALAERIGLPAHQVDSALRWYRGNAAKYVGNPERLKSSFLEHMRQDGVDVGHVEKMIEWHGQVSDRGVPENSAQPGADRDATDWNAEVARAAELRELKKNDPERFWGDPRLQRELTAINDRLEGQLSIETIAAAGDASAAARAAAAAATAAPVDRLTQIREARRNDPQGYDSDRKLQAEELSLITAALPGNAGTGGAPAGGGAIPAAGGPDAEH